MYIVIHVILSLSRSRPAVCPTCNMPYISLYSTTASPTCTCTCTVQQYAYIYIDMYMYMIVHNKSMMLLHETTFVLCQLLQRFSPAQLQCLPIDQLLQMLQLLQLLPPLVNQAAAA